MLHSDLMSADPGSRVQCVAYIPPGLLTAVDTLARDNSLTRSAMAGVLITEAVKQRIRNEIGEPS